MRLTLKLLFFADNTTLYLSHNNINSLKFHVQQEMIKVSSWMISNKLTLTYEKSCYVLVSKKKTLNDTNFRVLINQNLIEKSEYVKYLGVILKNSYKQTLQKNLKSLWNDL